jgi:hypothetical protein
MDVDRLPINDCSTNGCATIRDTPLAQGGCRGDCSKVSDAASDVAMYAPHSSIARIAESRCALRNCIEHRLKVTGRLGNHPQYVARRCLPRE